MCRKFGSRAVLTTSNHDGWRGSSMKEKCPAPPTKTKMEFLSPMTQIEMKFVAKPTENEKDISSTAVRLKRKSNHKLIMRSSVHIWHHYFWLYLASWLIVDCIVFTDTLVSGQKQVPRTEIQLLPKEVAEILLPCTLPIIWLPIQNRKPNSRLNSGTFCKIQIYCDPAK